MFQMGLCVIAKVVCSSGRIPENSHNVSEESIVGMPCLMTPGVGKSPGFDVINVPHRRVVGALVLTISASRSEQMYHTDVFSLSGYRSVFVATRRRSSQATGPLVAVIDDIHQNKG